MNDFNFRHLKGYDLKRSEDMQKVIARNIGPRQVGPSAPSHQNARTPRVTLGQSVVPPPVVTRPPPPVLVTPNSGLLPPDAVGPQTNVNTGWYGAGVMLFNFLGATAGGGGNNEIRVSSYVSVLHFETKALWITPYSGVTAGQFIQIFYSPDNSITNTAFPTGSQIGMDVGHLGDNPNPDNNKAFPVPQTAMNYDGFRTGAAFEGYIKVRLFFVAPAIALPLITVAIPYLYKTAPGNYLFAARS